MHFKRKGNGEIPFWKRIDIITYFGELGRLFAQQGLSCGILYLKK
jgi:hypothetical protein